MLDQRNSVLERIGSDITQAKSWKDAIKIAKMDRTIHKEQLMDQRGNKVNDFGLFWDDNNVFINRCGNAYVPVQNKDAFSFVDHFIGQQNGCKYISAGMQGNGSTIWCLAQTPWDIKIKGTGDITKTYILFKDHRDGGSAKAALTSKRLTCDNVFTTALRNGEKVFRLRHVGDVVGKMNEARKILLTVRGEMKSLEDKFNSLARKKATNEVIQKVFNKLFPKINESERVRNQARDILTRYELNDNNAFPSERGTAFNLLNAFTGYVDHEKTVRVGNIDVTVPGIDPDSHRDKVEYVKRAESAMFGSGDAFKTQALEYILEATKDVPEMSDKQIFDMSKRSMVDDILDKVDVN